MENDDYKDVRCTLGVALALWTGAVAAGAHGQVFSRLPVEVVVALAVFATAFCLAAVAWDARLRQWLDARRGAVARFAVLGAVATLAAAGTQLAGTPIAPASGPLLAPLLLFVVPATVALTGAAIGAAWRGAGGPVRSPGSTAPARRPAAT